MALCFSYRINRKQPNNVAPTPTAANGLEAAGREPARSLQPQRQQANAGRQRPGKVPCMDLLTAF